MRAKPRSGRFALFSLPAPWLTIGLFSCLGQTAWAAGPDESDRLARLGFAFDQKIHDAAQAPKRGAGLGLDSEPPPAGVVRLPKYTHTERSLPLDEREMLTPKGRVAQAKKKYLTPMYQKTFGPLSAVLSLFRDPLRGWSPNTPEALAIDEDFEQKHRNRQVGELTELGQLADEAAKIEAKAAEPKH